MSSQKIVKIDVRDEVNKYSAEGTMSKIRAAMRNEVQKIRLEFSPDCDIHSAEFLSFLRITDDYMRRKNSTLEIAGANESTSELLSIAKIGKIVDGGRADDSAKTPSASEGEQQ